MIDEETESPRCAGERSEEAVGVLKIIKAQARLGGGCLLLYPKKRSVKLRSGYNGMESLRIIFNRPSLSVACGSCTSHFL
jgi:hypothetical protein